MVLITTFDALSRNIFLSLPWLMRMSDQALAFFFPFSKALLQSFSKTNPP